MNIVEYTSFLVKSIVHEDDLVELKEIGNDENTINIEVMVKEIDMGALIGRSGINAKSIRTLVQAYSYLHDKKKIIINFDSF